MKNKLFIVVLFFSLYFEIQAQNGFTNIDTTSIELYWQKDYLSNVVFQNGDSIIVCYDTISWKEVNNKNRPAVFVTPENHHYYNYFAISDERQICPRFFLVPSYDQLKNEQSNIRILDRSNTALSAKYLFIEPIGRIDNSGGPYHVLKPSSTIFIATLSEWPDDPEYSFKSVKIDGKLILEPWPQFKNSGHSVKCVSNREAIFRDSLLNYKTIMTSEYFKFVGGLLETIEQFSNGEFIITIKGSISFNRNGDVINSVANFEPIYTNIKPKEFYSLKERINFEFQKFNSKPYYKGSLVSASTNLDLVFRREEVSNEKSSKFNGIKIKSTSFENVGLLDYAHRHGFKADIYRELLSVTDGGKTIIEKKSEKISQFHARGPIYSMFSIIPGFGLKTVNRIKYNNAKFLETKHHKLSKGLVISSFSLIAAGVFTKYFSNLNYNRYKANPLAGNEVERHYQNASLMNKFFVSSVIAYGALIVLDFSFTFSTGNKNKLVQYQLNKQLRKGNQITVY